MSLQLDVHLAKKSANDLQPVVQLAKKPANDLQPDYNWLRSQPMTYNLLYN